MTLTSLDEFLFMNVNRNFNPEDLTRKIVSEETSLLGMYKKNHPYCQGESSFSPAHSPIPGEKKKERALTLCPPCRQDFERPRKRLKNRQKKETGFIVAPRSPYLILAPGH
jgi:hypothetical protein